MTTRLLSALLVALWAAAPLGATEASTVVDDAALSDENAGSNWLSYGRTYSEKRFSPLAQIDKATVKELGLDWAFQSAPPPP